MPDSTDVFVIGGGPAGLAAAIAARQLGFRVVVADGAKPPIDKACGEALMPDATAALEQLGICVPAGEAYPVRGVRFLSGDLSAETLFPSCSRGLSIRRTALHRIMTERAAELGVERLWESVVTGISREHVKVRDHAIRTRWIVGADGVSSRVHRWANLGAHSRTGLRFAFRRHYRVRPWTDRIEIYWGKQSQAYANPVSCDEMCIAVASSSPELRLDAAMSEFPQLSEKLRGAEATSTERGAISANRKMERVWRGNVALIGDASGTVDAITGQGLGLSFTQAVVLADCLKGGNLAAYQTAHRRLSMRPLLMARLMRILDGRPRLQSRTLKVFRKHPEVFSGLLALHVGTLSPLDLARDGLTLGWGC